MPPTPPNRCVQVNYTVPKCYCHVYGHQQCVFLSHFPQYQRLYPQPSSSHQFHHHFYTWIPCYGQLYNRSIHNPSPLQIAFSRSFQVNTVVTPTRSVQPPGGIVKEGQFFFSNKVYVQLSIEQQIRLGAVNPGTQNKCRKIRPWLVLWKLNNGKVVVVCSTTRENKVWQGLSDNDLRSFLPIAPTAEHAERRALQLTADVKGVFVGRSLLFLEIEKEVPEDILGDYIGELTPESLQRIKSERQEWKWPSLTAGHDTTPPPETAGFGRNCSKGVATVGSERLVYNS